MTRGTSIWATPDGLDDASNRADSMGRDIQILARDAKAISLAGLPPSAMGWAKAGLTEAAAKADDAARGAVGQRNALRRRAALIRRADTIDQLRGLGRGVEAFEWWASKADVVRAEGSKGLLISTSRDLQAAKNLSNARRIWAASEWRRRKWQTPDDMYRHVRANKELLKRRHKLALDLKRYNDAIKVRRHLPPSIRNLPQHIPTSVSNSPLVKNPVTRRVPVVGPAIGFGADLAGGDSVKDAAGKGVASTAGAAVGATLGAAACASATIASFGPGALTCPALIAGGAVGLGMVAEGLYDKYLGSGKKAADPVKKVVGAVTPSRKSLKFLPGI